MESSIGTSCIRYSIIIGDEVFRAYIRVPDERGGFERNVAAPQGPRPFGDAECRRGIGHSGQYLHGAPACRGSGILGNRQAERVEGKATGAESRDYGLCRGTREGISRGPLSVCGSRRGG